MYLLSLEIYNQHRKHEFAFGGFPCLWSGGGGRMQILDLLSLISDITSLVKDFSDVSMSDSPFHLGVILVGSLSPKKEDS